MRQTQDIEQVVPATTAISCHFGFSVFEYGWYLATILTNDPDVPRGSPRAIGPWPYTGKLLRASKV
jgi:hypothetical protein